MLVEKNFEIPRGRADGLWHGDKGMISSVLFSDMEP